MTKYSVDPAVADKSCKARGSNLRVHYKVRCCSPPLLLPVPVLSPAVTMLWPGNRAGVGCS